MMSSSSPKLTLSLSKLESKLFNILQDSFQTIPDRTADQSLYVFGGWIRDKLIGNQSSDFDLLVPKRLLKEFLKRLKVLVPDIDIRLIILDEHPKIGKRLFNINLNNLSLKLGITELEGSLENEMKNKDLSINCLCYDVLNKRVVDSDLNEKALNDIKYQILSINGKISDTLKDSPSRVIRLIRFSLQFEFKLEKELLDYFRLIRAEKVNRMFNNSFNSQLKKLLKFVKDQSCLIRKLFDLLFLTNIIKHLSVWLDYGLKRIVFFLCAYDDESLKKMLSLGQLVKDKHYIALPTDLKTLIRIQKLFLRHKKSN